MFHGGGRPDRHLSTAFTPASTARRCPRSRVAWPVSPTTSGTWCITCSTCRRKSAAGSAAARQRACATTPAGRRPRGERRVPECDAVFNPTPVFHAGKVMRCDKPPLELNELGCRCERGSTQLEANWRTELAARRVQADGLLHGAITRRPVSCWASSGRARACCSTSSARCSASVAAASTTSAAADPGLSDVSAGRSRR